MQEMRSKCSPPVAEDLERPFRLGANLVDGPNALIGQSLIRQSLIGDVRWMVLLQTQQSSLFRYNSPVQFNCEEYASCARNFYGKLMVLLSFGSSNIPVC
jgi:hypothetical protein